MKIEAEKSSAWMIEFQKALVRGKHVILYGNVADQFLLNGSYCSLNGFLANFFQSEGYEIVGIYDLVDGFRFAPDAAQEQFNELVRRRTGGAQTPARPPGGEPPTGGEVPTTAPAWGTRGAAAPGAAASDGHTPPALHGPGEGPPPRGRLVAGAGSPAASPGAPSVVQTPRPAFGSEAPPPARDRMAAASRDPQQALAALRIAVSQNERPVAMTIAFSDKLVGNPDHQDLQERSLLIAIMKIFQEAAYMPAGRLRDRKNAVVIVARQLGDVPKWLYMENPFLEPVQVSRPRLEERKNFLRQYVRHFHGGEAVAEGQLEPIAQDFANLTDGFSAWDLDAVRRASLADAIAISRPKALIDFYKYGVQDDPWERLDETRVAEARTTLEQRVIGQPQALDAIESMLMSARVGVSMSGVSAKGGRPKGTFFFVGPTGVGKTELAKALTELIFSDETAFARFDMSEYAEQHAAERLTGAPPGFVGYEEGGLLTNRVRQRPFSLLLFDEIEKAHGRVMDKFLQILEDGRLTDGKGQTAYFSQSVIIFTSNIGSDTLKTQIKDGQMPAYDAVREHYRRAVADHFSRQLGRPELLNRFGENILVFDLIRPEFLPGIFGKFIRLLGQSVRERIHAQLALPDDSLQAMIVDLMKSGDNLLFGGRRVRALLEEHVERPLNRWLFTHRSVPDPLELTAVDSALYVNGNPAK
jgi:DNA polymerase III delta prime subunit